MSLLFLAKVKNTDRSQFEKQVRSYSHALRINPNWLMLVMWHESGLNPQAQNSIGAVGLIQFLPSTAYALGTSPEELLNMTASQQLYYVARYFAPYVGKIKSYADLHLATFYPAALDYTKNQHIGGYAVAAQNSVFDVDKDGIITKQNFLDYEKQFVNQNVPKKYLAKFNSRTMKILQISQAALALVLAVITIIVVIKSLN